MRIRDEDFDKKLKQTLGIKPHLSKNAEAALFAKAEALLATRRTRLASHELSLHRSAQNRSRRLTALREVFAIHPDAPATLATLAILVLAFVALYKAPSSHTMRTLSYADLPDFPQNNDAPAHYDAQRLAERQAYEREVEDAHRQTSGGI